jgi:hypothetical protein
LSQSDTRILSPDLLPDNKLGKSFKDLNIAFNEVLEAFRKARSEKKNKAST